MTDTASENWFQRESQRGFAYRFLATMYLNPPSGDWLGELVRDGLLQEFPVPSGNRKIADGLALLTGAAGLLPAEGTLAVYREDYDRLFVGPEHLPAPPWESVYRSEERLVFNRPTLKVRARYRKEGLAVENPGTPDDHIGLELLFMALLAERRAGGDPGAGTAQREFLECHLLKWAQSFCSDLFVLAATDLYRGLALLTDGVLIQDRHYLSQETVPFSEETVPLRH